ncbi:KUP/HAK/KT family potassium transporter [Aquirufa antheringensis]|jgi:KUP system potassium uptake protein|uniref:Probable potassium transport system protein Kup n=1 Tax=Aquirufa antheringensis TaxID=2516559 RepID=A0A4Q9B9P8_9BACT|nr:KUP/HAK/KT family potassium transporter [Aquirufa antheringensis]MCZ2485292.1 KUP/HAK/KT family potassium transporter [Aquirufa antheringensis]MCZ2488311.1 KUP/HAK/KT family potassium transporter [Aquirufa antheringensis]MCZ2490146.1 KUP/HAK/KT family potassium transporter [Aquirufa antheringensis]TBH72219.1 potassium transporter Kup [Aquirufa antheringensis]USQ03835.1 KUP/HAK/KT family potassium transporter [Aquirufa antheringensis]
MEHKHKSKATAAGLLVAMGIIYGDIGTSPLYVMQSIIGDNPINSLTVLGGLSCIFWTLTLQTTLKYVILILRADNKGEGGIFALFALVRRHAKWLTLPAIIGGATLLADGIITPPISVSSAIEGLKMLHHKDGTPFVTDTVPIVIVILTVLFIFQIFGTKVVGKLFGPIMLLWFSMLGLTGLIWIGQDWSIFRALSPVYAWELLTTHQAGSAGFWTLGAVFLCTTGAEALYSDLGHCGKENIRVSWVFVKIALILQYFGQGAWLLAHEGALLGVRKPIFELLPREFLFTGIMIATAAAVIASQALISGSFTLISEAIRLNFWPRVRLVYPSDQKGQLYVPSINILLWMGCVGVVLWFKESANMEAAYGLAITMTMLMTTSLMAYYLHIKKVDMWWILLFLAVYVSLEGSFLVANLQKFWHGGYVSLFIAGVIILIMWVWFRATRIKKKLTEYEKLSDYIEPLKELSKDETIPKYATHLVFMSNAGRVTDIESKIIYSIFQRRPKRADIYWFVHVDTLDDPYAMEYKVTVIEPDDIIKVNFKLGFKVEQRINLYFRKVVEEMVSRGEVDITSRYKSLNEQNVIGDFRFVVLEKFLSFDNELPLLDRMVMKAYFFVKQFTHSEDKYFGLDSDAVKLEKVPMIIKPITKCNLKRIE